MYYQWEKDALYLNCSVQPKSDGDRFAGTVGERLKVRIAAAATDGKANKRLIRFVAKQFGTRQAAVTIVNGHTSRHKRLCIRKPLNIPEELEIVEDNQV